MHLKSVCLLLFFKLFHIYGGSNPKIVLLYSLGILLLNQILLNKFVNHNLIEAFSNFDRNCISPFQFFIWGKFLLNKFVNHPIPTSLRHFQTLIGIAFRLIMIPIFIQCKVFFISRSKDLILCLKSHFRSSNGIF